MERHLKRYAPVRAAGLVVVAAMAVGCGQQPTSETLSDGVMATYVAAGDTFKVWITETQARADIVEVFTGSGDKEIPDGKLNGGPGTLQYNLPWAWHLDQDDIQMLTEAADDCDGTPSEVEENLDEWVNEIGRFCPGDAKLIFLESL